MLAGWLVDPLGVHSKTAGVVQSNVGLSINLQFLKILKTLTTLIYLAHFLGCFWYSLTDLSPENNWALSYDDGCAPPRAPSAAPRSPAEALPAAAGTCRSRSACATSTRSTGRRRR